MTTLADKIEALEKYALPEAHAELERIKHERDQAVEALQNMVGAFGNPDAGAVDRRLAMKDALTTLASIEGTGHE